MSDNNARIALKIQGLKREFSGRIVHNNITFELRSDELLGMLGGSGSGKSLILKSIIGLEHPDAGHIWFKEKDITELREPELQWVRSRIGYVFQSGALFDSLTVEENLTYPLKLHTSMTENQLHQAVNARLEVFNMGGTNELFPDELSGGMQKRIGLARATMLNPEIILLDEPTAGLDPINVARFSRTVKNLKRNKGLTGILVTHDIRSALSLCDRIAVLHEGRIHAIGPTAEITTNMDPVVQSFLSPNYEEAKEA